MSKINIAFSINNGYTEHLLIATYSLLSNNRDTSFNIFILSRDISAVNMRKIKKIESKFSNVIFNFINMKDKMEIFSSIELVIDYISIETYFRFVLADLLPGVDKVLYLDADILVTGDISSLWGIDIDNYYAAGVVDLHILEIGHKKVIGLGENDLYVNAGVLLFNLRDMRRDRVVQKLFKELKKNPRVRYQDQDILNLTLKGKILEVDKIYNFTWTHQQKFKELFNRVVIVHYTGPAKPWQTYGLGSRPYYFYEYDYYADDYDVCICDKVDKREQKFGLLTYKTENVGDDIQSIAARQFIPRIDYYIDRDDIDGTNYKESTQTKLIMNGWYTHSPQNWPPLSLKIKPLTTSMYFSYEYNEKVKKSITSKQSRDFFAKQSSIGARDKSTYKFLKSHNIRSHFSGCLTLTINKSKLIKKEDFVLAVDLPDKVLEVMRSQTKRKIIKLSPEIMTVDINPEERLKVAEWYLCLIQSAHCVVTSRLHAALPSLAVETPVLFITKDDHRETNRHLGLISHTHNLKESTYISNPSGYSLDNPPANKNSHLSIRERLIKECESFTGHYNTGGFLTKMPPFNLSDYDFIENFFNSMLLSYRYQNLAGILTSKSTYASTEIENYALHLKDLEREFEKIKNENNLLRRQKSIRGLIKRITSL